MEALGSACYGSWRALTNLTDISTISFVTFNVATILWGGGGGHLYIWHTTLCTMIIFGQADSKGLILNHCKRCDFRPRTASGVRPIYNMICNAAIYVLQTWTEGDLHWVSLSSTPESMVTPLSALITIYTSQTWLQKQFTVYWVPNH